MKMLGYSYSNEFNSPGAAFLFFKRVSSGSRGGGVGQGAGRSRGEGVVHLGRCLYPYWLHDAAIHALPTNCNRFLLLLPLAAYMRTGILLVISTCLRNRLGNGCRGANDARCPRATVYRLSTVWTRSHHETNPSNLPHCHFCPCQKLSLLHIQVYSSLIIASVCVCVCVCVCASMRPALMWLYRKALSAWCTAGPMCGRPRPVPHQQGQLLRPLWVRGSGLQVPTLFTLCLCNNRKSNPMFVTLSRLVDSLFLCCA